jgi:hypothetical protein
VKEKKLEQIPRAAAGASRGKFSQMEEFGQPFFDEIWEALHQAGFVDFDPSYMQDNFDVPAEISAIEIRTGQPTMVFGPGEFCLAISLFLGTSLGQWAVAKAYDEVYNAKLRPALQNLFAKLRKRRNAKRGTRSPEITTLVFNFWFDTSQVLVRVLAKVKPEEDHNAVEALVPEALRKALAWTEQHGITHRVLTYRIANSEITEHPILSEPISSYLPLKKSRPRWRLSCGNAGRRGPVGG